MQTWRRSRARCGIAQLLVALLGCVAFSAEGQQVPASNPARHPNSPAAIAYISSKLPTPITTDGRRAENSLSPNTLNDPASSQNSKGGFFT